MADYIFTCQTCKARWAEQTDDPAAVDCNACDRRGVTTVVRYRRRRSDALKPHKLQGANQLNVHQRPVRDLKRKVDPDAIELDGDDPSDEEDELEDEDDTEYVPAPEFNPEMRYSTGGTFVLARAATGPTTMRSTPWTRVTKPAGRGNTNAQFNGLSAQSHGTTTVVGNPGPFEWCHLIADSLGGPTTAINLFCGTFHANTAMLCIERILRGKTEFEVQVEIELQQGTHVAEKITYRVRRARSATQATKRAAPAPFEEVIDGLATGCTARDGSALSGRARAYITGR